MVLGILMDGSIVVGGYSLMLRYRRQFRCETGKNQTSRISRVYANQIYNGGFLPRTELLPELFHRGHDLCDPKKRFTSDN